MFENISSGVFGSYTTFGKYQGDNYRRDAERLDQMYRTTPRNYFYDNDEILKGVIVHA
jgi:hypothetical protein